MRLEDIFYNYPECIHYHVYTSECRTAELIVIAVTFVFLLIMVWYLAGKGDKKYEV